MTVMAMAEKPKARMAEVLKVEMTVVHVAVMTEA